MKDTIKDVFGKLPDFSELEQLSEKISELQFLKLSLDVKIKSGEAEVFKTAFTDPKFLVGGKPPSATYIESTFKHTGLNGELIPLREEYATVSANLERVRILMDVYKTMFDIWRTMSSNERTSGI